MLNTKLIFVLICFSTLCSAQQTKNWTLNVNASSCMLNDDILTLSKMAVEPGFQWNRQLYIGLNLGFVENTKDDYPQGFKFKGIMNSISVSARLLKPEYKFSPLIGLEIGNIFFSNARGAKISRDFVICSGGEGHEMMGTFNSFNYFARLKYGLDIQIGDMNFRLGTNFNVASIRMDEILKDDDYNNIIHGFGIESSLIFPLKFERNHFIKHNLNHKIEIKEEVIN